MSEETAAKAPNERRAQRIAKNIRAFAAAHGGADGVVEHVGAIGTRIAVVGTDGAWGDQVAPDHVTAQRAAELSGITLHDSFEGELGLRVQTSSYEWKRMAGNQLGGSQPRGKAA